MKTNDTNFTKSGVFFELNAFKMSEITVFDFLFQFQFQFIFQKNALTTIIQVQVTKTKT
jgi:hypothetical protein